MNDVTIRLDETSLVAMEHYDFGVRVRLQVEQEVVIIGWFEADVGRSTIKTNRVLLFEGRLPAGPNTVPVTIQAPNGPFDYVGRHLNIAWKLWVEVTPQGIRKFNAAKNVSISPTSLVARSDAPPVDSLTVIRPNAGIALLNAVLAGCLGALVGPLLALIPGVELTYDLYLGLAVVGSLLGFTSTYAVTSSRAFANFLGGGFDVVIDPIEATQGAPVEVRLKNGRQSMVPLDEVEARLRVFERALIDTQNNQTRWVEHELHDEVQDGRVTGRYVETTFEFELPTGLPQSVESKYASIVWGFDVVVRLGFAPDWKVFIPISVGIPAARVTDDSNPVAR